MKTMSGIAGLVLLFALGCSQTLSGPDVDQVKKDLVGQSFLGNNNRHTIQVVQDVVIQERSTDKDAKTEDLRVLVTISGNDFGPYTGQGVLVVRYKHFEQGWKVQSVDPVRSSWPTGW